MTISRNPEDYYPSEHAYAQAKKRGIDLPLVASTIQDGEIKNSHKENCKLFVEEFHFTDRPVYCVANINDGEIITIGWRKD